MRTHEVHKKNRKSWIKHTTDISTIIYIFSFPYKKYGSHDSSDSFFGVEILEKYNDENL